MRQANTGKELKLNQISTKFGRIESCATHIHDGEQGPFPCWLAECNGGFVVELLTIPSDTEVLEILIQGSAALMTYKASQTC